MSPLSRVPSFPLLASLFVAGSFLASPVHAQDAAPTVIHAPPPGEEPPVAPAETVPPAAVEAAPPAVLPPPEAPVVALSPGALQAFEKRHLEIHPAWTFGVVPGPSWGVSWGVGGWGPPHGHWNVHVSVPSPPTVVVASQPWAVFEDRQRLQVPAYLERIGDQERLDDLNRRIDRTRTWSGAFIGGAIAGGVTATAGMARWSTAQNAWEARNGEMIVSSGLFLVAVGLVSNSFTRAHLHDLRDDYRTTLSLPEVEAAVEGYNAELRKELGLPPGEAPYREGPPRRR